MRKTLAAVCAAYLVSGCSGETVPADGDGGSGGSVSQDGGSGQQAGAAGSGNASAVTCGLGTRLEGNQCVAIRYAADGGSPGYVPPGSGGNAGEPATGGSAGEPGSGGSAGGSATGGTGGSGTCPTECYTCAAMIDPRYLACRVGSHPGMCTSAGRDLFWALHDCLDTFCDPWCITELSGECESGMNCTCPYPDDEGIGSASGCTVPSPECMACRLAQIEDNCAAEHTACMDECGITGAPCDGDGDCCSSDGCNGGTCACSRLGDPCTPGGAPWPDDSCCQGLQCESGSCCATLGEAAEDAGGCCSGLGWNAGTCCGEAGTPCYAEAQCCSGTCDAGQCT